MKSRLVSGIVCALVLASVVGVSAQEQSKAAAPAAARQRTFDTPKAAADALIAAAATYDVPALEEILGPDGKGLVVTSDPVQDKNQLETFAAKAREKTEVVPDAKNPNRAILSVGRRGLADAGPDRPQERPLVLRLEGGQAGTPLPPRRPERARRHRVCHEFVDAQQSTPSRSTTARA